MSNYLYEMATSAQQQKFEKFQHHPLRAQALSLMKQAVKAGRLDPRTRGVAWGVTVCPDAKTIFRINRGNVALLDVRRDVSEKLDTTGKINFIVMAVIREKLTRPDALRGVAIGTGFVQHVKDSVVLFANFDEWSQKLLDQNDVAEAFAAHANAVQRDLPNSNWHNPLIDSLLDS